MGAIIGVTMPIGAVIMRIHHLTMGAIIGPSCPSVQSSWWVHHLTMGAAIIAGLNIAGSSLRDSSWRG